MNNDVNSLEKIEKGDQFQKSDTAKYLQNKIFEKGYYKRINEFLKKEKIKLSFSLVREVNKPNKDDKKINIEFSFMTKSNNKMIEIQEKIENINKIQNNNTNHLI